MSSQPNQIPPNVNLKQQLTNHNMLVFDIFGQHLHHEAGLTRILVWLDQLEQPDWTEQELVANSTLHSEEQAHPSQLRYEIIKQRWFALGDAKVAFGLVARSGDEQAKRQAVEKVIQANKLLTEAQKTNFNPV